MKLSRPLRFIAFVGVAIILGSVLNVAVTKKSYSENYPNLERTDEWTLSRK